MLTVPAASRSGSGKIAGPELQGHPATALSRVAPAGLLLTELHGVTREELGVVAPRVEYLQIPRVERDTARPLPQATGTTQG